MRRAAIAVVAALVGLTGCTAGSPGAPGTASPSLSEPAASLSPAPVPTAAARPGRAAPSLPSPAAASTTPEPVSPSDTDTDTDPPGTAAPVAAGFAATIDPIDPGLAVRMASSWREGCPVPLSDLRLLTLGYRGLDGSDRQGELVVAASVADDVVATFRRLYEVGYPIASMRLVDDFGGDDDASMSANNTSAFNCRPVTGGSGFSEHSYGTAVDVNPVQNPYVAGSTVLPVEARQYLDRPNSPGVIHAGDEVVRAFAEHGFSWGGDWAGPIDYQHFSVSGR